MRWVFHDFATNEPFCGREVVQKEGRYLRSSGSLPHGRLGLTGLRNSHDRDHRGRDRGNGEKRWRLVLPVPQRFFPLSKDRKRLRLGLDSDNPQSARQLYAALLDGFQTW